MGDINSFGIRMWSLYHIAIKQGVVISQQRSGTSSESNGFYIKSNAEICRKDKCFLKYFVFDKDRKNTCYHEFYKGKWDGKTFWKSDSISLYDDILCEHPGFADAIIEIIPNYHPCGNTEISSEQWRAIGNVVKQKDCASMAIYQEADRWLKKVFEEYDCFTILGL